MNSNDSGKNDSENRLFGEILLFFVLIAPLVYLGVLFPTLPDRIPMHYNAAGEIDRYGNKAEIWLPVLLVSLPVYLILMAVPYLERATATSKKIPVTMTYRSFYPVRLVLQLCLSALAALIVYTTSQEGTDPGRWIGVLVSAIFIGLGAVMPQSMAESSMNIRPSWMEKNPELRNKTYAFGRRFWIVGGIVSIAVFFLVPQEALFLTIFCVVLLLSLVPIGYGWRLSKQAVQR